MDSRADAPVERQDAAPAATPRTSESTTCSRRARRCPVDFRNRVIYYVGPVDPVRDEVVGPAGPTTATRMDKFTEMMLATNRPHRDDRQGGARSGRRSRRSASTRLPTSWRVGGAAYLVSKAIRESRVVAFARPRHGSDLRVRRQGHAGDGRGRRDGQFGPRDRPARMEAAHRPDSRRRGLGAQRRGTESADIRDASWGPPAEGIPMARCMLTVPRY